MYPYLVLDLPHDATDAQVADRYTQLVERFPPDRAPETFLAIRRAYEALETERARLKTRLFHFARGLTEKEATIPRPDGGERRRLSHEELAELIRESSRRGADR